eukprot:m.1396292 g.1396292  ORF g.1396292 m.1396292 type:complete len:838 (+) comp24995_c0_seq22:359-2872(+)
MSAPVCVTDVDCSHVNCGGSQSDRATCTDAGQCQCAERALFFVVFGIYIIALLWVAAYGKYLTKSYIEDRKTKTTKEMTTTEQLKDRFMPNANFGMWIMGLTIFSTTFSGYSVIGVPGEAELTGFVALRWLAIGISFTLTMLVYYPRFRRIGIARGYASPSDIFADRFNCQSLRLLATLVMLFVQFVFTTAQLKAIYDIIDVIALGRISAYSTTIFIAIILVICDIIGGQRGISLSDAIQAGIMLCAYLLMPFVLLSHYPSMGELHDPCADNSTQCIAAVRPWFAQYPTVGGSCLPVNNATDSDCYRSHFANSTLYNEGVARWGVNVDDRIEFDHQALSMLGFILNGFAFPLQTHFLQKLFLSRSERVLKFAFIILTVGFFIATFPSYYIGMLVPVQFGTDTGSPLPYACGELMNKGGFNQFVAVIALNAILAAIMSTADSTIIGACNVWTCTWMRGFLFKNRSTVAYQRCSMITTPIIAVLALVFALHADEIRFDTLIQIQNSVNWQIIPALTVAMFTDRIAAYPLLCGMVVGLAVTIGLELKHSLDHVGSDHYFDRHRFDPLLPSGLYGVMVNVAATILAQYVLSAMGSPLANDDKRTTDQVDLKIRKGYGSQRLLASTIRSDIVPGIEPFSNRVPRILAGVGFALIVLALPWYESPFASQGIASGGMPTWAAGLTAAVTLAYVLQIAIIALWNTPVVVKLNSQYMFDTAVMPSAALAAINVGAENDADVPSPVRDGANAVVHGTSSPVGTGTPHAKTAERLSLSATYDSDDCYDGDIGSSVPRRKKKSASRSSSRTHSRQNSADNLDGDITYVALTAAGTSDGSGDDYDAAFAD